MPDYHADPIAILFIRSDLRLVVDLQNCIKAQQSRAYAQKSKISNLQQMAKTVKLHSGKRIRYQRKFTKRLTSSITLQMNDAGKRQRTPKHKSNL